MTIVFNSAPAAFVVRRCIPREPSSLGFCRLRLLKNLTTTKTFSLPLVPRSVLSSDVYLNVVLSGFARFRKSLWDVFQHCATVTIVLSVFLQLPFTNCFDTISTNERRTTVCTLKSRLPFVVVRLNAESRGGKRYCTAASGDVSSSNDERLTRLDEIGLPSIRCCVGRGIPRALFRRACTRDACLLHHSPFPDRSQVLSISSPFKRLYRREQRLFIEATKRTTPLPLLGRIFSSSYYYIR